MQELWGKTSPYKSLLHHMIDTGVMGRTLLTQGALYPVLKKLESLLPESNIVDTVACLISLHDIGKCHPYFQGKNTSCEYICKLREENKLSLQPPTNYYHEFGSKYILENFLKDLPTKVIQALGSVLRHHHQRQKYSNERISIPLNMDPEFWEKQQQMLFEKLCTVFNPDFSIFAHCRNIDSMAVLLWGCTILSDWLASGEDSFSINEKLPIDEYVEEADRISMEVLKKTGLLIGKLLPAQEFCQLWSWIKPDGLRALQTACIDFVTEWGKSKETPSFVLIEAPMGEGKTEAALYLVSYLINAHKKSGFYIAMPTTATSNNIYSRLQTMLANHGIPGAKLMHGQAWMLEGNVEYKGQTDDAQEASSWLSPLKKGLLSQYAVGTVDQVMMAIMRIRYGVLRLTGIASKVIVLDEIHAYDSYMMAIIERLLEWCSALSIPIVILSATLPKERREMLIKAYSGSQSVPKSDAYPLITSVS